MELQVIQQKIYEIRGQKVMFDFDLPALYEVETKVFNQAVKRNSDLFPDDFMFRITKGEFQNLRSQFVTSKQGGTRYLPFVFTEHGVAMLASVLKSERARKMAIQYADIVEQVVQIRERVSNHDAQLNQIYDAIENLLDDRTEKEQSSKPEPIGFKVPRSG